MLSSAIAPLRIQKDANKLMVEILLNQQSGKSNM